jgi:hypothetical protein
MQIRPFAILLVSFSTTACAGREAVSSLAGKTSIVLNDYRQELSAFARHQTAIGQANEQRLLRLKELTEQQQGRTGRRISGWRLARDKEALETYALVSEQDADRLLAGTTVLRAATPVAREVAAVRFDAAQVEAVVKKLKVLEQSPTFWDNVRFSVAYGEELHDAYKKSVEKAADEGAEATVEAAEEQSEVAQALPQ